MHRSEEPIHPGPGLPGDFAQHANQCVHILFVILDAQAHPDEARQDDAGESREQDQAQVGHARAQRMNLEQTLDQQMGAVATVSHTDPAPLGQFFGHQVVRDVLQAKDDDATFLGNLGESGSSIP